MIEYRARGDAHMALTRLDKLLADSGLYAWNADHTYVQKIQ